MGAFDDALAVRDEVNPPAVDSSLSANGRPRVVIQTGEAPDNKKSPFQTALEIRDETKAAPSASFSDRFNGEKREIGTGEALGRGIASGVTANFYDELRGLHEAGGAKPNEPMSLSSVLRGAVGRMSGDKDAVRNYDEAVTRERSSSQQAQEQHPAATLIGNVAGGLALPVGGAPAGMTKAARAGYGAAVGAGYGAAYGAGEGDGVGDRLTRAATGGTLGGVLGAAAPSVIDGVAKVGGVISHGVGAALGHPIDTIKAMINPEKEARSRVSGALKSDMDSGKSMSGPDYIAARREGQPVAVVDLGGENMRALGRSAANTSATGRASLDDMTSARFGDQSERVSGFVRGLSPVGGDAHKTTEALEAAAKAANKPAYAKAYADGQNIQFHSGFQQLMQAPAMQDAMKAATTTGANKAAAQGFTPVKNPFTFPDGQLPQLTNPNAKPSLQYWDAVKQNLDDKIGTAVRAGEKGQATDLLALKSQLVSHLDQAVPSYAAARSGAASFFGAENALEAGQKFITMRGSMSEARAAHAKMNPAQKTLFAEGYVSDLADKVSKVSDNRSVIIDKIFNSKDGRERTEMALGRANADKLETFLRVENISDQARKMLGNSTTARQLIEANLAGGMGKALTTSAIGGLAAGAQAYGAGQVDAKTVMTLAVAGGLAGGRAYINTKLSQRVGELLASQEPKDMIMVARMASNNPQVGKAIRQAEVALQKIGAQSSPELAPKLLPGISAVPVAADQDQPQR